MYISMYFILLHLYENFDANFMLKHEYINTKYKCFRHLAPNYDVNSLIHSLVPAH